MSAAESPDAFAEERLAVAGGSVSVIYLVNEKIRKKKTMRYKKNYL